MLSRTTTLHALLEEYPFLRERLRGLRPAFGRLASPDQSDRWARVITLGELATAMDLPWPELRRDLEGEVRRVTGSAPSGPPEAWTRDVRQDDDLRAVLRELESGSSLSTAARLLDARTPGLDAEGVAALVRAVETRSPRADEDVAPAGGPQADWPPARLSLPPGHPVRTLLEEVARLGELAAHVDEVLDGLGPDPAPARWRQSRPVLQGLLERLEQLERQRRRLRLAWRATLASRGGQGVSAHVDDAMGSACDAVRQARAEAKAADALAATAAARAAVQAVRAALAAEEELLAPAALRWLDDDDWEVVAEQERLVGPAIAGDQAP